MVSSRKRQTLPYFRKQLNLFLWRTLTLYHEISYRPFPKTQSNFASTVEIPNTHECKITRIDTLLCKWGTFLFSSTTENLWITQLLWCVFSALMIDTISVLQFISSPRRWSCQTILSMSQAWKQLNLLKWNGFICSKFVDISEENINMDYINEGLMFPRNRDIDGKVVLVLKSKQHVRGVERLNE